MYYPNRNSARARPLFVVHPASNTLPARMCKLRTPSPNTCKYSLRVKAAAALRAVAKIDTMTLPDTYLKPTSRLPTPEVIIRDGREEDLLSAVIAFSLSCHQLQRTHVAQASTVLQLHADVLDDKLSILLNDDVTLAYDLANEFLSSLLSSN